MDGAIFRVLIVVGEVNLLHVALAFLLAPLDAHMVDVIDCQVVDFVVGEPTLLA